MLTPRRIADLEQEFQERLPPFDARLLHMVIKGLAMSIEATHAHLIPAGKGKHWVLSMSTALFVGGDRIDAEAALFADAVKSVTYSFPIEKGPAAALQLHLHGVPFPTVLIMPALSGGDLKEKAFVYNGTGTLLLYPHERRCFCKMGHVDRPCTYCGGKGMAKSFFGNRGLAEKMDELYRGIGKQVLAH